MPALDYQGMSNQDVGRIIAYLRSVPAVDNQPAPMRPNGSEINPIMPWRNRSRMADTEIKALWLYLKTQ